MDIDNDANAVSRRNAMLAVGGAAVVLGAVTARTLPAQILGSASGTGTPNIWEREYWTLESAGIAEWTEQLRYNFRVVDDRGLRVTLRLIKVSPLNSGGERPAELARSSAFAALFDPGVNMHVKGDRIYTLIHGTYGEMQIFLKATGYQKRLEAVFN